MPSIFSYIILTIFCLWLFLLVCFLCRYSFTRCVHVDEEDGRVVFYFHNWQNLQERGIESLITKEAKDHSQLQDIEMCIVCDEESSSGNRTQSLESQNILENYSRQNSALFQHCAICLEAFTVGEEVSWSKILLDCNHTYHRGCIREWLSCSPVCPCCRTSFIHRKDLTANVCLFGGKAAKTRWNKKREKIVSRRAQGEFCTMHGLKFPPNNEIDAVLHSIEITEEKESSVLPHVTSSTLVGQSGTADSRYEV